MSVNVLYSTQAYAVGGGDSRTETVDGSLSLKLSTPREIGGDGAPGVNPEHLFASGYASCFLGAMKYVSSQHRHLPVGASTKVTATVGVGPRSAGGFGLQVDLNVALPDLDSAQANELVERANAVCPYSNAVRDNIEVSFHVQPGK